MWIFLLVLTFAIELLSFLICFAYGVVNVVFIAALLGYSPETRDAHTWSSVLHMATVVGLSHVGIVLFMYAIIIPLRLLWPMFERLWLGVRKPTSQELMKMHLACSSLASAAQRHSLPFKRPLRWVVLDTPHINIRYIGWTLVIDRGLFQSRFFEPLLAHEMAQSRNSDRWAKTILQFFAPKFCVVGFLLGIGIGLGPLIMYLPWKWYWRRRVYSFDEYASRLGQRIQLTNALETLCLPLDEATSFGFFTRDKPYVALRIDRLGRLII